jgi:hypothetical protein
MGADMAFPDVASSLKLATVVPVQAAALHSIHPHTECAPHCSVPHIAQTQSRILMSHVPAHVFGLMRMIWSCAGPPPSTNPPPLDQLSELLADARSDWPAAGRPDASGIVRSESLV